ncbi:mitochondrial inner-membrane-bound regulator-domain-containing protein [Scheffersomyces xylosifermentans]|uniref:mitochondrial inner-membrane-bound regulator-domain-containing protein n=1 Tax=Scheffersomyces xylosifermentans TaxID=1304137 RepID=UPI00315DF5AF
MFLGHLESPRGVQLAKRCFPRNFTVTSTVLGWKNVLPPITLHEMQDSSNIRSYQPKSKQGTNNNKQIFLEPKETVNKNFNSLMSKIQKSGQNNVYTSKMSFIDDELNQDDGTQESIVSFVDKFRPSASEINRMRFRKVQSELEKSFTQPQLSKYLETKYSESEYSTVRKSTKRVIKKKLAQRIINDIWGVKVNTKLTDAGDLTTSKTITLSDLDIFLIKSNRRILHWLSANGARIKLVKEKKELEISGTDSQVNNVEVNLMSFLQESEKKEIDLSNIKQLSIEKYGDFSLDKVARYTDVYFKDLGKDIYEIHSQSSHQFERLKRLLLWSLNFNRHTKEDLCLPESTENSELLPFKDELSLTWNNRLQPLFTLRESTNSNVTRNEHLLRDLEKYSDNKMNQEQPQIITESHDEVDSTDGTSTAVSADEITNKFQLPEAQLDSMYEKLINFDYRKSLVGVGNVSPPIFTVTLGNVLIEGENSKDKAENIADALFPAAPDLSENVKFKFNSNVQLVADKALSLRMYDATTDSIEALFKEDRYKNSVQITFLPSLFKKENQDINIEELTKYPPVEMWVDLKNNMTPDLDTLQLVTVEGENSSYLSIPSSKSDLKVCCQLSGDLLKGEDTESSESLIEKDEEEFDVEDILNARANRYDRFKSQPGLNLFLESSKLDFQEETSITPYIDLNINGETVRYSYICVSFRKKLSFEYNNGREIQFNSVESGELGGRKIEVLLVGDITDDLNRDNFVELMNDATKFISEL